MLKGMWLNSSRNTGTLFLIFRVHKVENNRGFECVI